MFKTPEIPEHIRTLPSLPGFVNPFSIGITGPNLFGTETLCGDWDGDLLLLAQDFARVEEVRQVLKDRGSQAAWRHNDGDGRYRAGSDTNPAICSLLGTIGKRIDLYGSNHGDCGVLYGNACFFLSEGERKNSALAAGVNASTPMLEFVLDNMKNVKTIACLGKISFEGTTRNLGKFASWNEYRYAQKVLKVRNLNIFALAHPGHYGRFNRSKLSLNEDVLTAMKNDWEKMGRTLPRQSLSDIHRVASESFTSEQRSP